MKRRLDRNKTHQDRPDWRGADFLEGVNGEGEPEVVLQALGKSLRAPDDLVLEFREGSREMRKVEEYEHAQPGKDGAEEDDGDQRGEPEREPQSVVEDDHEGVDQVDEQDGEENHDHNGGRQLERRTGEEHHNRHEESLGGS